MRRRPLAERGIAQRPRTFGASRPLLRNSLNSSRVLGQSEDYLMYLQRSPALMEYVDGKGVAVPSSTLIGVDINVSVDG